MRTLAQIVDSYDKDGAISRRVAMEPTDLGLEGPAAPGGTPPAVAVAAAAAAVAALAVLASIN